MEGLDFIIKVQTEFQSTNKKHKQDALSCYFSMDKLIFNARFFSLTVNVNQFLFWSDLDFVGISLESNYLGTNKGLVLTERRDWVTL